MTPAEVQKRLDTLYDELTSEFVPLYKAVDDMRTVMFERIFESFLNQDGQKIPLPARRGGNYNTPYSPGYARFKELRKNPLELTGFLRNNFAGEPLTTDGLNCGIGFNATEYGKAQSLQYGKEVNPVYDSFRGYGIIFQPTEDEQAEMLAYHQQLLAEDIENSLGS